MRSSLLVVSVAFCFGCALSQIPSTWNLATSDSACNPPIKNINICGSSAGNAVVSSLDVALCFTKMTNSLNNLTADYIEVCLDPGCSGIEVEDVFAFLEKNGTVSGNCFDDSSDECPVTSCVDGSSPTFYKAQAVEQIGSTEVDIKTAILKYGSVFAMIDASQLLEYNGGVANCTQPAIDAGVYITGWGTNYWIIATVFGPNFGMEGYVYVSQGEDQDCGISANSFSVIPASLKNH